MQPDLKRNLSNVMMLQCSFFSLTALKFTYDKCQLSVRGWQQLFIWSVWCDGSTSAVWIWPPLITGLHHVWHTVIRAVRQKQKHLYCTHIWVPGSSFTGGEQKETGIAERAHNNCTCFLNRCWKNRDTLNGSTSLDSDCLAWRGATAVF